MSDNTSPDDSLSNRISSSRRSFLAAVGGVSGAAGLAASTTDTSDENEALSAGGMATNITSQKRRNSYVTANPGSFDANELKSHELYWLTNGEFGVYNGTSTEQLPMGSPDKPVPAVNTEEGTIKDLRATWHLTDRRGRLNNVGKPITQMEDLTNWSASTGSIASYTADPLKGSQSMKVTLSGTSPYKAKLTYTLPSSIDVRNWDLTMAIRGVTDASSIGSIEVEFVGGNGRIEYNLFNGLDTGQTWYYPCGGFDLAGGFLPDPRNVTDINVNIYGDIAGAEIAIDDLRLVPKPDHGMVIFNGANGFVDVYEDFFQPLDQRGMPFSVTMEAGSLGESSTSPWGSTRYMNIDECQEVREKGGCFGIESYDQNTGGGLDGLTKAELHEQYRKAKEVILGNNANNVKLCEPDALPHSPPNAKLTADMIDVGSKYLGFIQQYVQTNACTTAPVGGDMMYQSITEPSLSAVQNAVDFADQWNQVVVVHLHSLDYDPITASEFETLLDYIEGKEHVRVGTFEDLNEMRLGRRTSETALRERKTAFISTDGAATQYTINHGRPCKMRPTSLMPDLSSTATPIDGYTNTSQGSFDIVFSSAPASGTAQVDYVIE